MRRARGGFAWVSLMDVLFAVFGGLVVLTVLLSLNMSQSSPVTDKPFHMVSLGIKTQTSFDKVYEQVALLHLAVDLITASGKVEEEWSAVVEAPQQPASAVFASSSNADGTLSMLFFVPDPQFVEGKRLFLALRNIAALEELTPKQLQSSISVQVNIKNGRVACDPPVFTISLAELLTRARNDPPRGARILPDDHLDKGASQEVRRACGNSIFFKGGEVVFHETPT